MKDRDRKRFQSSITWFNQFFDGMKQIFELVTTLLPVGFLPDDFSTTIDNFYYPAFKATPSIPPYYALILPGSMAALQLVAVIDENIFPPHGSFNIEPSLVAVLHNRPDKYAWVDEFALRVINSNNLEGLKKYRETVYGKLAGRYPADFFAFQVQYDLFSDIRNPPEAVTKYIINPIATGLYKGWLSEDMLADSPVSSTNSIEEG
jgi:hypothetical protein